MNTPRDKRPPIAEAMRWVSRITSVALEMLVPGLIGNWLDQRWGTSFLAPTGFAFGLVAATYHLLVMTGAIKRGGRKKLPPKKDKEP